MFLKRFTKAEFAAARERRHGLRGRRGEDAASSVEWKCTAHIHLPLEYKAAKIIIAARERGLRVVEAISWPWPLGCSLCFFRMSCLSCSSAWPLDLSLQHTILGSASSLTKLIMVSSVGRNADLLVFSFFSLPKDCGGSHYWGADPLPAIVMIETAES